MPIHTPWILGQPGWHRKRWLNSINQIGQTVRLSFLRKTIKNQERAFSEFGTDGRKTMAGCIGVEHEWLLFDLGICVYCWGVILKMFVSLIFPFEKTSPNLTRIYSITRSKN